MIAGCPDDRFDGRILLLLPADRVFSKGISAGQETVSKQIVPCGVTA
jgi:hypothetical protein